jgi:DNA-binding response OmpR family regulator
LVVDDDAGFRRAVIRVLERAGYECTPLADGAEADAAIASARPDLVIMDIGMPRRTGIETLRDLRATDSGSAIPVLLMSGHADLLRAAGPMIGGHDGLIAKPFDPEGLRSAVRRLLERARA